MGSEVLQIAVSESGGTRVLMLRGELDSYTSPRLGAAAKTLVETVDKVIVNLDALEFIDSSGLAALVGMWVDARERNVPLVLSCRSPRIHRVLEITGLVNLFTVIGGDGDAGLPARSDVAQVVTGKSTFAAGVDTRRSRVLSPPVTPHKRIGG